MTLYQMHIKELLPDILISVETVFSNCEKEKSWDYEKTVCEHQSIVDKLILDAYVFHSDAIKKDEDLSNAYMHLLEMLIRLNSEKADGMRLQVMVSSVEYGGRIFAVEAAAYDLDGQPGLNVPNSRERTALKEALASVGQTAGTSVNVTRSAGQQVLSELARGGLQASSQYVAGKLREVKITLKANHQLLLISKQQ